MSDRTASNIGVRSVIMLCVLAGVIASCTSPPESATPINPSPSPTVAATPDHKGVKDAKIQSEADKLVSLFGSMPKVAVYIVDEPIRTSRTDTEPGVAYTMCSPDKTPTIYMKKAFTTKAPKPQLTNILKHELTHAWFCTQGIQTGHDARFRAKFKEVGGFGN